MASDYEIERRCLCNKKLGLVQLSTTHLIWTPDSAADGNDIRVSFTNIKQFQVSKQGQAKRAMMKLECKDENGTILLNFQKNFADRDAIRDLLNKLQARGSKALATQNGSANGSNVQKAPAKLLSPEEREWRVKLMGKREVLRLRQSLVDGGAVSDDVFWNGMKFRYKPNGDIRPNGKEVEEENAPLEAKDRGTPSDAFIVGKKGAVDVSKWEGKVPTPAERHLVIMEHPSVARAQKALKHKLNEEQFWELFRMSSMVRQSGRLTKVQSAQMADADNIFAPYLARELELEEEEKEKRAKGISRGLDIDHFDDHRSAHVIDGHAAGGEARPSKRTRGLDTTALRLLKTVNRHGELIVEEGSASNWDEHAEKGRPLDDLDEEDDKIFPKVDIEGSRKSAPAKRGHNDDNASMRSAAHSAWNALHNWHADVSRFENPVAGSGETLKALIKTMHP